MPWGWTCGGTCPGPWPCSRATSPYGSWWLRHRGPTSRSAGPQGDGRFLTAGVGRRGGSPPWRPGPVAAAPRCSGCRTPSPRWRGAPSRSWRPCTATASGVVSTSSRLVTSGWLPPMRSSRYARRRSPSWPTSVAAAVAAIIGAGHLAELAFTGKDISAERANEIGLVNDLVADAAGVDKAAQRWPRDRGQLPHRRPGHQGRACGQRRAHRGRGPGLRRHLNAGMLASDDLTEAVTAFMGEACGRSSPAADPQRLRRHQRFSERSRRVSSARTPESSTSGATSFTMSSAESSKAATSAPRHRARPRKPARPGSRAPSPRRPAGAGTKGSSRDNARAPRARGRAQRTGPPHPRRRSRFGSGRIPRGWPPHYGATPQEAGRAPLSRPSPPSGAQ